LKANHTTPTFLDFILTASCLSVALRPLIFQYKMFQFLVFMETREEQVTRSTLGQLIKKTSAPGLRSTRPMTGSPNITAQKRYQLL
jgi:hypothetical protein